MQQTHTIATRTWKPSRARPLAEVDALHEKWRQGSGPDAAAAATGVSIALKDGPALFLRRAGRNAVVSPGSVELPVYDGAGVALFRLRVDVVIDADGLCVRRGAQTIIPIPGGLEPTAAVIQRKACLGDAWRRAVEYLTTSDDAPDFERMARTAVGGKRNTNHGLTPINRPAELREVARLCGEAAAAGRRLSAAELATKLSAFRGAPMTADNARGRKSQAVKAGLLPEPGTTRPRV